MSKVKVIKADIVLSELRLLKKGLKEDTKRTPKKLIYVGEVNRRIVQLIKDLKEKI